MGRRKSIGTADRLLGCGPRTKAHRNFLDTRGTVRTCLRVYRSIVRLNCAIYIDGRFGSVRRAGLRCVRLVEGTER